MARTYARARQHTQGIAGEDEIATRRQGWVVGEGFDVPNRIAGQCQGPQICQPLQGVQIDDKIVCQRQRRQ